MTRNTFGKYVLVFLTAPTHLWQVGDSSEQNGSFKMALYKAKRNYLTYRDVSDQQFVPTNIIALVKTAWKDSFACVRQLRKAIMQ
jgi:hypothetical protein